MSRKSGLTARSAFSRPRLYYTSKPKGSLSPYASDKIALSLSAERNVEALCLTREVLPSIAFLGRAGESQVYCIRHARLSDSRQQRPRHSGLSVRSEDYAIAAIMRRGATSRVRKAWRASPKQRNGHVVTGCP